MKVEDYLQYIATPFTHKPLVILSSLTGVILAFFETSVGISLALAGIFFGLAVADIVMGVYKNVIVNNDKFESQLFLKKILVVAVVFGSLFMTTALGNFAHDMRVPTDSVTVFQESIVYMFALVKLFFIVAYMGYEIASLKENSDAIGWKNMSDVLGLILSPLTWMKVSLRSKIKADSHEGSSD